MIARSIFQNGFNIFYPPIAWSPGNSYIDVFPFYHLLVSCCYLLFGEHDVIGRLISIFFFTGSAYFLYHFFRKYDTKQTSLFALLFFIIAPLNVVMGRNFMIESAMLFFSIAMLYFFSQWIESEKMRDYLLAGVCSLLAFLTKPYTLYLLLPAGYLAYAKYNKQILAQKKLYLYLLFTLRIKQILHLVRQ